MKTISAVKKTSIFLVCLFLLVQTSFLWAADDIIGLWEVRMDFDGREMFADLNVSENPDSSLSAKWGRSEVSDVNFEDGKLTFVRTVGRDEFQFTSNFEATLNGNKLTGRMTNDWGQIDLVCVRPKTISPAVGQWNMKIAVPQGVDINAVMIISQNDDGTLTGQWTKEPGEHLISDVKFKDGKLTFNRHVKLPDMDFEFDTPFEGTIEGDKITGQMKNEMGQWEVIGTRIGTDIIGDWELTITNEWGTQTPILRIYPDLSGRYEVFGSFVPIKDLKLEGETVTFSMDLGFGDQTFQMDFKGILKDETLTGNLISPRGEQPATGKKIS